MLEDLAAGQKAALVEQEVLEDGELLGRQVDIVAVDLHRVGGGIESHLAGMELGLSVGKVAAGQRPQPGDHLAEGEGLDQVVVRTSIEAGDTIVDRVARGEHQDRALDAPIAKAAGDLEAVQPGQHDVEDDGVVGGR